MPERASERAGPDLQALVSLAVLFGARYLFAFTLPASHVAGAYWGGGWHWMTVVYAFALLPLAELVLPANPRNHDAARESALAKHSLFVALLWLAVGVAWGSVALSLYVAYAHNLAWHELVALGLSGGIVQAVMGLNVGHELGHHKSRIHRFGAHLALWPSLYLHYYIDHNRGHHKWVATPRDPSSAPLGMSLQRFIGRSVALTWWSAWRIEGRMRLRKQLAPLGLGNAMWRNLLLTVAFPAVIGFALGPLALAAWAITAAVSILMLETVNYIEHYGLSRQFDERGRPERVQAYHSWSSDHMLGRLVMFEGSRHADHHYLASRPYQILRHLDGPQMPTGYPGMMLLAQVPPLWFYVMNRRALNAKPASPVQTTESSAPPSP